MVGSTEAAHLDHFRMAASFSKERANGALKKEVKEKSRVGRLRPSKDSLREKGYGDMEGEELI